jgi:transketolase
MKEKLLFLQNIALNLRIDSIRATTASKSGHPTSCMSAADIVATIFCNFLRYDIKNPKNPNNDRFILSKGHAIPVVYAAWKQLGVISDKELMTLRKFDSKLEGHPTPRFEYNEAATGSLGQGLAIGAGMALNAKHEKLDYKTYVMLGDGEISEGSVWEAAEVCAHYNLDNLITIVDCNRLGQSGESLHNHHVEKYAKKFEAFGFKTFVIDGHDIEQIIKTIEQAHEIKDQPIVIVAKTFKGYGLENIQDKNGYHGKPFKTEELDKVIDELKQRFIRAWEFQGKANADRLDPSRRSLLVRPPQGERPNNQPDRPKEAAGRLDVSVEALAKSEGPNRSVQLNLQKDINSKFFNQDQKIATRKAFGYALVALGKENKNIFALDGDVQNSTYTEFFAKEIPDRFIECFIAEQTMVGVTTGLELRGKIAFAATFGTFFTRAYDQIRMAGIGRNALRLCGSHCGVSIGEDGPSQMALEDLAMMRTIPNSIILYPSDGVSAYKLTELMANYNDGVSYLRTSRPATPMLYNKDEKFEIGGCKVLRQSDNDKACIIAAGVTLHEALKAHQELKEQGIDVSVIDLYSVKPLDEKTIKAIAQKSGNKIVTVEDHYIQGGLGEAVATALVNDSISVHILAIKNISRSGKPEKLLAHAQIDAKNVVKKIKEII